MSSHRVEKVTSVIKEALSLVILQDIKDINIPQLFNITHIKLSKDLKVAKVYFSFFDKREDDENFITDFLDVLKENNGKIRHYLAQRVYLKYVPELIFYYDKSIKEGSRVLNIIEKLSE